jgi:Predicted membrane protein
VGLQCFKLASLSFFPFGKEVRYGGGAGSFLLNVIWLLVSGLPLALEHVAMGLLLCVTILGIPFGLQQFKLAKLALLPFGAEVVIL